MRPLRWLMLATAVPAAGGLGGVVRYTTELAAALAGRDDVELSMLGDLSARAALEQLTGDRARVRTFPLPAPGAAGALVERWHPWAARGGFDVVQGTKHLLPRRTSALRLLTVHDMLLLDRPADFPGLKRRLLPGPYRRSIREADVPICVSAATRDRLAAHEPAAAARAVVVPLATATSLREAIPEPVPVLAGRRFALVVGDASPRKNLATIARAWPAVREALPDAVLAIAGPPDWSRSPADADRTALLDTGAAAALGRVTDAQLRWCYENARVVVCPSIAEGFGLPVAEALDLGASVLISDDPALREAAAGRETAVVPAGSVSDWSSTTVEVLSKGRPVVRGAHEGSTDRTWDDVASETVRAAVDRLARGAADHTRVRW